MDEKFFVLMLITHFLADFALQTHEQASKKSHDWNALTFHVATYSIIWLFMSWIYFQDMNSALYFTCITFIAHFCTDAITSRISKRFFDKKDIHNGFVTVDFDQVLHYIQLWLTYDFINTL